MHNGAGHNGQTSAEALRLLVAAQGAADFVRDADVSANGASLVSAANYAAMRSLLTITTGTYAPTVTAGSNVDAASAFADFNYVRVNNVVQVFGALSADVTLAATGSLLNISLPVASNIGSVADLCGVGFSRNQLGLGMEIRGDTATDDAEVQWQSGTTTSNLNFYIMFSYVIN